MPWLAIEAHILGGRYHGRGDDGRSAEWPPNPHRLFQALVAAAHLGFRRTEEAEAKQAALRWLESRPAPDITVPPSAELSALRLYVPNNDLDQSDLVKPKGEKASALRTAKELRPRHLDGDRTIRFLWHIGEDEWTAARPHAETIAGEARHLHSLGLGIDLVAGDGRIFTEAAKPKLAGEAYIPDAGGFGWRTPARGSLDELLERHAALAGRVRAVGGRGPRVAASPAPPRAWREVGYRKLAAGRVRTTHAFRLVDGEGEPCSFDPRRTIEVAAWLRHAAHMAAQGLKLDQPFIDGFVCGHGEDEAAKTERFAYLPLPTLTPRGRDGRIRRVLVAEPFDGGGGKARAVARRLNGAPLAAEGTGEIMAELRTGPANEGVFARYLPADGARVWGTVTPIVLPGRDDRRSQKAVGLVLKALAQAGYTTPVEEITLQAEPVFPGQERAGAYRVPVHLKAYPRTHALITFAEPVSGPVAIGGGRFAGLGLLATVG